MDFKVLSIDPGSRYTGIAYKVSNEYITTELEIVNGAWSFVKMFEWNLVLCENFTAVSISKYGLATVRIIGGVEALCQDRNIPMKTQQNFERNKYKRQAHEMILKEKGKVVRDHTIDALAHLLAWEAANGNTK